MKKYLFSIIIFVSFAVGCRAQDTVRYGDPYYLFEDMVYYQDSATLSYFTMSYLFLRALWKLTLGVMCIFCNCSVSLNEKVQPRSTNLPGASTSP